MKVHNIERCLFADSAKGLIHIGVFGDACACNTLSMFLH